MNKKVIIVAVLILSLGVGGYILYKKSKTPTRKMFDEMVSNCKTPCDVFQGLTQSQLDKLFKGYQTLLKADAQFMIDFMGKSTTDTSDNRKFNTLFSQMRKGLIK